MYLEKVLEHLRTWEDFMYEELEYEPISAMRELQSMATYLSSRNPNLKLWYRYDTVLNELDKGSWKEAEKIAGEKKRALGTLSNLASCLARVPVNVESFNEVSLAGMLALANNVRPEIFLAVDGVNDEYAASGQGTHSEFQALKENFQSIIGKTNTSDGYFLSCDDKLKSVPFQPTRFAVDPYFIEGGKRYEITLTSELATYTLGAVNELCKPNE